MVRSWDVKRGRLKDSAPKVLFDAMPIIHVTAVSNAQPLDQQRYNTFLHIILVF